MKKNPRDFKNFGKANALILDSIDFEGYDFQRQPETDLEKIQALFDTYQQEYGKWSERKIGRFNSVIQWLSGLPSCLTLPSYNSDIYDWLVSSGTIDKDCSEKVLDKYIERWWSYMAMRLMGLFKWADRGIY